MSKFVRLLGNLHLWSFFFLSVSGLNQGLCGAAVGTESCPPTNFVSHAVYKNSGRPSTPAVCLEQKYSPHKWKDKAIWWNVCLPSDAFLFLWVCVFVREGSCFFVCFCAFCLPVNYWWLFLTPINTLAVVLSSQPVKPVIPQGKLNDFSISRHFFFYLCGCTHVCTSLAVCESITVWPLEMEMSDSLVP